MNKLLIWDIDGTLLTCKNAGKYSLNKTFQEEFGIENAFEGIEMAGKMDLNILSSIINKNNVANYNLNDLIYKYGKNLEKHLKMSKNFKILPNVKKNLHNLQKDNRIYNVIASGNSEIGSILKLKKAEMFDYFRIGSYGNNFDNRTCLVRNAINIAKFAYGIDFINENIYMIGDTPDDIIAGKENNIKTIALATGGYSLEILESNEPDFLFDELPEDLISIIF